MTERSYQIMLVMTMAVLMWASGASLIWADCCYRQHSKRTWFRLGSGFLVMALASVAALVVTL